MKNKTPQEQLCELIKNATADELHIISAVFRYALEHPNKTPEECVMWMLGGKNNG